MSVHPPCAPAPRFFRRPVPLVLALALTTAGCAAPIKAILGKEERPTAAASAVPSEALQAALVAKAQTLLAERRAAVRPDDNAKAVEPAIRRPPPAALAKPAEPRPAVQAMLVRVRAGQEAPTDRSIAPGAPPGRLAMQFRLKDETRLADSPSGSRAPVLGEALLRFEGVRTELDEENNRRLAALTARSENPSGATLVLHAGLAGEAPAWERMRLASARSRVIAEHVPPPLAVEQRFDPTLPVGTARLELMRRP